MSKVNLDTIKPWITTRVNQLLGIDDDVIVEFVFNLLENTQHPDPKEMQMNLTGFLNGKNARIFMQELWDLLTSAQENIGGIPSIFLEQKKEEIRQKKVGLLFFLFVENCEGSVSISMYMYVGSDISLYTVFTVVSSFKTLQSTGSATLWPLSPTDLCTLG